MTAPCSYATLHHAGLYRALPAPSPRMLNEPRQKAARTREMQNLCMKLKAGHSSHGLHTGRILRQGYPWVNANAHKAGIYLDLVGPGIKIAFALRRTALPGPSGIHFQHPLRVAAARGALSTKNPPLAPETSETGGSAVQNQTLA